ncbi:hypothetical protein L596_017085 [Steinernema carpocapsae]|uniref:Uncharacterized protein n=1 Tax=Steinernema carpocapsae TaxID=34508 RepID=A0A4U5N0H6_STECR|nr:hypothetical protein L596_017085 [Steinernema carpocapsae]
MFDSIRLMYHNIYAQFRFCRLLDYLTITNNTLTIGASKHPVSASASSALLTWECLERFAQSFQLSLPENFNVFQTSAERRRQTNFVRAHKGTTLTKRRLLWERG